MNAQKALKILSLFLGICSLAVSYVFFTNTGFTKAIPHLTMLQSQIIAVCFIILGAYLIIRNRRI
jgi:hypothetical protein